MVQLTRWQRIRTRAYLTLVGMKRRVTLGTRAVLIDGDRVLLVRHTYLPGWQFPGGGVEPGESAAENAAREVLEETGYRLTAEPTLFGFYHVVNATTNRDHISVFLCRDFQVAQPFAPNAEIAEAGWFDVDGLPAETTEATRRRIAEIFAGAPQPTRW